MSEQILHIPRSMNNTELPKNITIDHFYESNCAGYAFSTHHALGSLVEKPYGYSSMLIPYYGEVIPNVDLIDLSSSSKKQNALYSQTVIYDLNNHVVCVNTETAKRIKICKSDSGSDDDKDSYCYKSRPLNNATSPNFQFQKPKASAAHKSNPGQLLIACLFVVPVILGYV